MADTPLARVTPALWALVGALAIATGAQVSVPMVPVPMTLQTLAVVGVGLLGGARVGAGAAALYLGLVLVGLPVLSDGRAAGGAAFLDLASAGYVVGFVPAGAVAGLAHRRRPGWLLAGGLVAHGVVLAVGVPVLATWIGGAEALDKGLWPFLPGAVVKSVVAAGAAAGWQRWRAREDR
jgi:biotin transport system substrate-specific component